MLQGLDDNRTIREHLHAVVPAVHPYLSPVLLMIRPVIPFQFSFIATKPCSVLGDAPALLQMWSICFLKAFLRWRLIYAQLYCLDPIAVMSID
jgi:hypothetical protein